MHFKIVYFYWPLTLWKNVSPDVFVFITYKFVQYTVSPLCGNVFVIFFAASFLFFFCEFSLLLTFFLLLTFYFILLCFSLFFLSHGQCHSSSVVTSHVRENVLDVLFNTARLFFIACALWIAVVATLTIQTTKSHVTQATFCSDVIETTSTWTFASHPTNYSYVVISSFF